MMAMKLVQTQVWGAWLYEGVLLPGESVPQHGWKLLEVLPGRYTKAPIGMKPLEGQVLVLMQGEHADVITPD